MKVNIFVDYSSLITLNDFIKNYNKPISKIMWSNNKINDNYFLITINYNDLVNLMELEY